MNRKRKPARRNQPDRPPRKLGKLEREALAMGCFELMPDEITAIGMFGDFGSRPEKKRGQPKKPTKPRSAKA